MIEIKSGYLLKLNTKRYGIVLENGETQLEYAIIIPIVDALGCFVIESYYDENQQLCQKLTDWICDVSDLTNEDVSEIYDLSYCGRLVDITTRELLWENKGGLLIEY